MSASGTTTVSGLSQQRIKANRLRELHHGSRLLLLPNVWDVASARIFENAGFPALATTSAGVAFTLGYPDGEKVSRDEMLEVVARIARAVRVPVTADVEAGYGARPEDAALTARAVIQAGAVGLNLEDGTEDAENPLVELSLQLEKLAAVRQEAKDADVPIVINARTDVYLLNVGAPENRYDEAMRRAAAFKHAGADCVFVPGLRDPQVITRFVRELSFPVNILAGPGFPPLPELEKIGVARVTLGSAPMRATLGLVQRMAEELKASGTYQALEGAPSHGDVNKMMRKTA
jgi:2-methylisocitrate lyase-like PEP mutase family enzyme